MSPRHSQRGMTLVMTLLFLVIITMLAVTSFSTSNTNLRVTGNMVARQEALSVAQATIEQTISNNMFVENPVAVAAAQYPVDIDGDGAADYSARLTPAPACQKIYILKIDELDPGSTEDLACMASSVQAGSLTDAPDLGALAGASMCANTQWNVRAEVTDQRTGARVAVNQGIGIRKERTEAIDFCT